MQPRLTRKVWWEYLEEDLRELLLQSSLLIDTAEKWEKELSSRQMDKASSKKEFHDYSFVVFPAAKAYEGFLKKLFLDLGFITQREFSGKRFRVGKALNPDLDKRLRARFSVYDKLIDFCGGGNLADKLWETWKECRNLLFHWFPNEKNAITLDEAEERVDLIIDSIDKAFKECRV